MKCFCKQIYWSSLFCFLDMRDPKIAAEIAKELRKFHQVDIPGSKKPQLWNYLFKFLKKGRWLMLLVWDCCFYVNGISNMTPFLAQVSNINNIFVCYQMHLAAAALKFEDNEQQKTYEKISFREIQDEVQELKVPWSWQCTFWYFRPILPFLEWYFPIFSLGTNSSWSFPGIVGHVA